MKLQRNFNTYKFIVTAMVVVGVGFLLGSLVLSHLLLGEKDKGIEQERRVVVSPLQPTPPPAETPQPKNADAPPKPSTVSATTLVGAVGDSHPHDAHQDKTQPASEPSAQIEEEVEILDENMFIDADGNVTDWEKWKLARMHKHGWFKPEDVPINYGEPVTSPDRPTPAGVYVWTKYKEGGGPGFETAPEHVKARANELKEALDRATESGDAREMFRITEALSQLHRPYKKYPSGVLRIHLGSIPDAWKPYFRDVLEIEKQAFHEEMQMLRPNR